MEYPDILITPGAKLSLAATLDLTSEGANQALHLEGNGAGFVSLANAFVYFANQLPDTFELSALPFITADTRLVVQLAEGSPAVDGDLAELPGSDGGGYQWRFSRQVLLELAQDIHSLGYMAPNTLAFQHGTKSGELQLTCTRNTEQ